MPDIDKKVAAAKADIARAQAARAAAEHKYQVARAQAEAAGRDLVTEFGADFPQEARELIADLEAQLEAECTTVREALIRANGRGDAL